MFICLPGTATYPLQMHAYHKCASYSASEEVYPQETER